MTSKVETLKKAFEGRVRVVEGLQASGNNGYFNQYSFEGIRKEKL